MATPSISRQNRDILIELRTDIRYIREKVKGHGKAIRLLKRKSQDNIIWHKEWGAQYKIIVGIAGFIGGAIVFVVKGTWDFISHRI
jgi:hypothetical protein